MSGGQTGARGRGKTGLALSSPRAGQTEEWPPASWTLVNVTHAPQRNFWQEKGKYTITLEPTTVEGETQLGFFCRQLPMSPESSSHQPRSHGEAGTPAVAAESTSGWQTRMSFSPLGCGARPRGAA